jgi:hypothetical protein
MDMGVFTITFLLLFEGKIPFRGVASSINIGQHLPPEVDRSSAWTNGLCGTYGQEI